MWPTGIAGDGVLVGLGVGGGEAVWVGGVVGVATDEGVGEGVAEGDAVGCGVG